MFKKVRNLLVVALLSGGLALLTTSGCSSDSNGSGATGARAAAAVGDRWQAARRLAVQQAARHGGEQAVQQAARLAARLAAQQAARRRRSRWLGWRRRLGGEAGGSWWRGRRRGWCGGWLGGRPAGAARLVRAARLARPAGRQAARLARRRA